ncbi:pyocin knob domain-containing protein [Paraburkholderia sp. BR10882]|uniref:pyocin knob domain-containing protein n=1 Tax=unclassified Paraburkholderia TaxID=2615204 RepID=UPI0034CDBCE8
MTRTTSDFAVATSLPGMLLGRGTAGNQQVPLSLIQTYIQQVIASTASNTDGAVNFRGAWNATYDYAPNDVVSYNDKVYLMIAASVLLSSTTPDQDATNWLCLFGQMVIAVDLNNVPNMAFFYSQGAANVPDSDPTGYGFSVLNGTGFGVQVYWSSDGGTLYTRGKNSGTWSAWAIQATTYAKAQVPGGEGSGTIYVNAVNNGEFYSTITVNTQLNMAGWASVTGKMQRFRWEIVNGGAYATTWGPYNNLHWIKSDGTITTDFTTLGITWNASGSNFFEFWSRDGGATVYGRALAS